VLTIALQTLNGARGESWHLLTAAATSPASSAQNATTSTSVATMIARHFRAGERGCMPAGLPLLRGGAATSP
jgi:hypothetical protein